MGRFPLSPGMQAPACFDPAVPAAGDHDANETKAIAKGGRGSASMAAPPVYMWAARVIPGGLLVCLATCCEIPKWLVVSFSSDIFSRGLRPQFGSFVRACLICPMRATTPSTYFFIGC